MSKRRPFFSGVSTALVTPFYKGQIDFASLKKLIKQQIDGGIQGFVVCGSTGEAATLSPQEKEKVLKFVLSEVAGQIPVIVGSGTNNTAESCVLTKKFSKTKVAGFLLVTPYYNKPPQRGLVEHFKKISKQTKKPVILYNVPSRTITEIQIPTLLELAKIKNIVGIKEAAGKLSVIQEMVREVPENFSVISGDDETFPEAMEFGAKGVISVVSHIIPRQCLDFKNNKEKIIQASKALFMESNPIPVKFALKQMGILKSDELRLPLVSLQENLRTKLKEALQLLEVL